MDNIDFKDCRTVKDLSHFLGMNYKKLSSLIYPNTNRLYVTFIIPKKSGEDRTIDAPKPILKAIQRKLSIEFNKIYNPRKNTHGFICGKSIVTNANQHINKRYIFNIDFKDFFHSIHFGRIRNLFMSDLFAFTYEVATVLAHICCHNNRLPQGAPTSPVLTNIISFKLDNDLFKLSFDNKCSVTRYADDVSFSFSCNKRNFPKDILYFNKAKEIVPGIKLREVIEKNGFEINNNKVRLQNKTQRQQVTGITVNQKLNIHRSYIIKTRSMLHAWDKYGLEQAAKEYLSKYIEKDYSNNDKNRINSNESLFFKQVISGRINYIGMVRGINDEIYRKIRYKYSCLIGVPDENLKKSLDDILSESVFILENNIGIAQGTAFLVEQLGLVTAYHVIEDINEENSCLIDFFRCNEVDKKRKATLFKTSQKNDIAIFTLNNNFQDITPLKLGDASKLKRGVEIKLFGFPGYNTGDECHCDNGKITQKKKLYGFDVWLVDIPITHGISGGPVLNANNEVIGIAIVGSEKNDKSTISQGFIPITKALAMLQDQ
ncbi:reverse transcriptase domain-containing protein [Legionella fallonii]|uniref:RNA-directed DNA polymerase n=1 Tax=Legionella fallonii LLAP-10 TaxID=1212491 RepID=A0A098G720_9GAMM|nr:reverse transcriptase domain-containing protein [Legionella fallonii]CEG57295.1 putative Trypsin-like serine proteases [Legionella fallonii LLAP-10]